MTTTADPKIAAKIKEKYGYVCSDVLKEYAKFDKKKVGDDGKIIQSSKFKKLLFFSLNNLTLQWEGIFNAKI